MEHNDPKVKRVLEFGMVTRTISGGYMVEGKGPSVVYLAGNDDFSAGFF